MKLRLTARDLALIIISGAICAATALAFRLPNAPDENNLIGLIGSLIGAAIAVIAGLIVLARQFETVDERNLRTVRNLLLSFRKSGNELKSPAAALDPVKFVTDAQIFFLALKSVTAELRASTPGMAVVAQMFAHGYVEQRLEHLSTPGLGINAVDLENCGNEVVDLAQGSMNLLGLSA